MSNHDNLPDPFVTLTTTSTSLHGTFDTGAFNTFYEQPAVIHPNVAQDVSVTESNFAKTAGTYYAPLVPSAASTVFYKKYLIGAQNKDYLEYTQGTGPTTFNALGPFLARFASSKIPPFLIRKLDNAYSDGSVLLKQSFMVGTETRHTVGVVQDVPNDYISIGDILNPQSNDHTTGTWFNGRNVLYAHKSICYTSAPMLVDLAYGDEFKFYTPDFSQIDPEIQHLYIPCGYLGSDARMSTVMVLRAFFKPTTTLSPLAVNYNNNQPANTFLRVSAWINSSRVFFINSFFCKTTSSVQAVELPDVGFEIIVETNKALENLVDVAVKPYKNVVTTQLQGFWNTADFNVIHDYMRPFVKTLCHPIKRNAAYPDPKYSFPNYPNLCACVGQDGSAAAIQNTFADVRPVNAPILRQHCVNKACNEATTGVYRWYDSKCGPNVVCTDNVQLQLQSQDALTNIVFNSSDVSCDTASTALLETATSDITTTVNNTTSAFLPPAFRTAAPALLNYDQLDTAANVFYVPVTPTTPDNMPTDPILFELFTTSTLVPEDTTPGNGPTTWSGLGPTLFKLHQSKTPPFIVKKLGNLPFTDLIVTGTNRTDQNVRFQTGRMSRVPVDYLPVGDLIAMTRSDDATSNRSYLMLFAHKDICFTDMTIETIQIQCAGLSCINTTRGDKTYLSEDIKGMYTNIGMFYRTTMLYPVLVLKTFAYYKPFGGISYFTENTVGNCVLQAFLSNRNEGYNFALNQTYPFHNTSYFAKYYDAKATGLQIFPSAMQALQHLARMVTNIADNPDNLKWQSLANPVTGELISMTLQRIVAGNDNNNNESGLCHPKDFTLAESIAGRSYIKGFVDFCACVGTDGAENALNAIVQPYIDTNGNEIPPRVKLRCTSNICNDYSNSKVYRYDTLCPPLQLCVQNVNVRDKFGNLITQSVNFNNISQTCNYSPTPLLPSGPPARPSGPSGPLGPAGPSPSWSGSGPSGSSGPSGPPGPLQQTILKKDDTNLLLIIGGALGGLALILILVLAFIISKRRSTASVESNN